MKLSRISYLIGVGLVSLSLGACGTNSKSGEWKAGGGSEWQVGGYEQHHPQQGTRTLSAMGTQCYFCSGKPVKQPVIVMDGDKDGVVDGQDDCPTTPTGIVVDSKGCALDSDKDGVPGYRDNCPATSRGVTVDSMGCPPDHDGDGVPDYRDKCPTTPANVMVNPRGCALDSDKDGVVDYKDSCPNTPKGASVNAKGCWVLKNLNFDTGKSTIKSSSHKMLNKVATILKSTQNMNVEIQGHTDNRGSNSMNAALSKARAKAVLKYLVGQGVDPDTLTANGYGPNQPADSNDTAEGRANNRRVELKPMQ
jgi:OmpA-OmpF porin, OOP family